jgi:hypothetical protein
MHAHCQGSLLCNVGTASEPGAWTHLSLTKPPDVPKPVIATGHKVLKCYKVASMGTKAFLILNCWQSHGECIQFAEISLNKCPPHRTEAWGTAHCLRYMLGMTLVGKAQQVLPKNSTVMKSWKDIQGGAHTFPTLKTHYYELWIESTNL